MDFGIIYMLVDPRDSVVRYVGQTTLGISRRLSLHIQAAKDHKDNSYLYNWMKQVISNGFKPEIYIMEDNIPVEKLTEIEQYWFDWLKLKGANLVNTGNFVDCPTRGHRWAKPKPKKVWKETAMNNRKSRRMQFFLDLARDPKHFKFHMV